VDGVDKYLVEQGYRSYRKAIRRGASIRSDLVKRFLSIESQLCWDIKREGFDQFFLRFDYTRMALDAQRGAPFTKEDVADRLFNSFPDDLCEDILRRFRNSPSLEELKEAAERHNAVLQRRAVHGRQSRQSAVDVINENTALTMPVDSETTTGEATAQTNCRLFMSNLRYDVSEKQVLEALRSILKLSGVSPTSVRLFRDRNSPGRNRGIGIIEFRDPTSATNALSSIDGKAVLGRTLRVRRDSPAAKRRHTEESAQPTTPIVAETIISSGAPDTPMPAASTPSPQAQAGGQQDSTVSPTSVCLTNENPSLVASLTESFSLMSNDDAVPVEVHLDKLMRSSQVGRHSTGTLTDISAAVQLADGSSHTVQWLLDSGAAEHLVSATVGNLLVDSPSVNLARPVTLLFANGQQQKVDVARRVTLRIGNDCYNTTVLVVDGLTLPGVLSLHKLAKDAGSLSWFMCPDGSELLQLGLSNVLKLTSQNIALNASCPVFVALSDSDDSDDVKSLRMALSPIERCGEHHNVILAKNKDSDDNEDEEKAEIKLDYVVGDDGSKRARVSLPWLSSARPSPTDRGLGRNASIARDVANCRRLREMGSTWFDDFEKELLDMQDKGYIRPLTAAEVAENLPVASVVLALRPGHKTQPVRITIDARGVNAHLDSGDVSLLRKALKTILLRCRLSPLAAFEDVARAFPQLVLHLPDTVSLNFRCSNRYWRCMRLPFGLTCSPACLCIALQDIRSILICNYGSTTEAYFPYMDDLLYTGWSRSVLSQRRERGRSLLLSQASMHCQPAKSIEFSDPTLREEPDFSHVSTQGSSVAPDSLVVDSQKPTSTVQLGYVWSISEDTVTVQRPEASKAPTTRRVAFKQLSKLYDPLGLYIEVVAKQRLLLSLASSNTQSWDTTDIGEELSQAICNFIPSSLPPVPRFCDLRQGLVIFCDAAGNGCICCDARGVADGRRLTAYQATLNPKWSVARLELCALVAGSKMLQEVLQQRDVVLDSGTNIPDVWICTDSQLNAWRIRRNSRFDEKYLPLFERRRVHLLRTSLSALASETSIPIHLAHIPGRENPADRGTRPSIDMNSEVMSMNGDDMRSVLQKVSVVSTYSSTSEEDDCFDEFDAGDTTEEELCVSFVGAISTLKKSICDIVLDDELLNSVRIAQEFSPQINELRQKTSLDFLGYVVQDGLLRRVGSVALDDSNRGSCVISQIVVPDDRRDLQMEIVKYFHDWHGGHPGRTALIRWIWRHFYWKQLDQRVRSFNRNCLGCQARQQAATRRRVMSSRPPACPVRFGPFGIVYFDSSGPYQFVCSDDGHSKSGKHYVFSVVCQATRFIRVVASPDKSAKGAAQALYQLLTEEGRPNLVVVDQALCTPVVAAVVKDFGVMIVFWVIPMQLVMLNLSDKQCMMDDYATKLAEGRTIALSEMSDIWWLKRRAVREKLLGRALRRAGRDLREGACGFRWRPQLGPFGKLNTGWEPVTLIKKKSDSVWRVKLGDGKEAD
ncbi:hypothetical protein FOL47_010565, partial [Perkinsus chesapeaki]